MHFESKFNISSLLTSLSLSQKFLQLYVSSFIHDHVLNLQFTLHLSSTKLVFFFCVAQAATSETRIWETLSCFNSSQRSSWSFLSKYMPLLSGLFHSSRSILSPHFCDNLMICVSMWLVNYCFNTYYFFFPPFIIK